MFKDRLSEILSSKGVTKTQLSVALGYSPQAVSNWTLGKSSPDPDTLSKIADYFNVSLDYLCGRVDYPELVIKKAPPESGAEEFERPKDVPDKLTPEEIKAVRAFLDAQKKAQNK